MKTIDKTPLYKDGQLSLIDRAKAIMQFGAGWIKEIEAQKSVVAVMERTLDKNYTVLRNVMPPGLDATIPIILIGPTGIYVICVTPLVGMYRAKGDQWGSISGNAFKLEKPNLLTRTERLTRAVQVFLQRQGYADLPTVEAVLLCSDPAIHIDSLRPIVRVVMRDALERFIVSITQGRVVLSPESIFDIVNRILTPPSSTSPAASPVTPATDAAALSAEPQEDDPFASTYALLGSQPEPVPTPADFAAPLPPPRFVQNAPAASTPVRRQVRPRRRGLTGKQWAFLAGMFAVWCLIVAAFIFIISNPSLLP